MSTLTLEPIGYVACDREYRSETPRQSVDAENEGVIVLVSNRNFEPALDDLAGFGRLWVIFGFHLNYQRDWRPKAAPPITDGKKRVGLFATRSPYRPNPIGMSCVEFVKIEGLSVFIRNFDMLNGTPVFDIKPYIPRSDAFPDAATGWLPEFAPEYRVEFTTQARQRARWIHQHAGLDLIHFARTQLSVDPLNKKRKRVAERDGALFIHCRTWKLGFSIQESLVTVSLVFSNYSAEDLAPNAPDPYHDKDIHRLFTRAMENPV